MNEISMAVLYVMILGVITMMLGLFFEQTNLIIVASVCVISAVNLHCANAIYIGITKLASQKRSGNG